MPFINRWSDQAGVDPLIVATIIRHEGGNYLAGGLRAKATGVLEFFGSFGVRNSNRAQPAF